MTTFSPDQPHSFKSIVKKSLEAGEKDQLLDFLTQSIGEMLRTEQDLLLSSLYRMDIPESKVQEVLEGKRGEVDRGLAELVLERQEESLASREQYPQPKIKDPEASL